MSDPQAPPALPDPFEDLHETLSKVPGMGLVRRRREAAAEAEESSDDGSAGR